MSDPAASTVPWVTLVVTDLDDYLVGQQRAALSSKALAAGQTDPWNRHWPDVANRVRAEVRGRPPHPQTGAVQNLVSRTPLSIPPSLRWVACLLLVDAMQGRLAVVQGLTEDQVRRVKDATGYLRRVSEGDVPVETPPDPEVVPTVQQAGGPEVVRLPGPCAPGPVSRDGLGMLC